MTDSKLYKEKSQKLLELRQEARAAHLKGKLYKHLELQIHSLDKELKAFCAMLPFKSIPVGNYKQ